MAVRHPMSRGELDTNLTIKGAWGFSRRITFADTTTAALDAIGNAINTSDDKVDGAVYRNTTTGKLVIAQGNAAADVWKDALGSTVHSPA